MGPFEFRARWRDTGKVIPDFEKEYTIDALNDEAFVVEQYISKKDADDRRVYAGDILVFPGAEQYKYVVRWDANECGFGVFLDTIGSSINCFKPGIVALMVVVNNTYERAKEEKNAPIR